MSSDSSYTNDGTKTEESEKEDLSSENDNSERNNSISKRKKNKKLSNVVTIKSSSSSDSDSGVSTKRDVHIKYTKAEDDYYSKNSMELKRVVGAKNPTCTACYDTVYIKDAPQVLTHKALGVLLCKKCFTFYGKGNFKTDAEGYDEYCRWCANGGELLICNSCTNGFCRKCIKRNLGRTAERNVVKAKSWECYICDMTPLIEIRAQHRAFLNQLQNDSKFSRTEEKAIKTRMKFDVLKAKRNAMKNRHASNWLFEVISQTSDKLLECASQVQRLQLGLENPSHDKAQIVRRLLRLNKAMQGVLGEQENLISNALGISNEDILNNKALLKTKMNILDPEKVSSQRKTNSSDSDSSESEPTKKKRNLRKKKSKLKTKSKKYGTSNEDDVSDNQTRNGSVKAEPDVKFSLKILSPSLINAKHENSLLHELVNGKAKLDIKLNSEACKAENNINESITKSKDVTSDQDIFMSSDESGNKHDKNLTDKNHLKTDVDLDNNKKLVDSVIKQKNDIHNKNAAEVPVEKQNKLIKEQTLNETSEQNKLIKEQTLNETSKQNEENSSNGMEEVSEEPSEKESHLTSLSEIEDEQESTKKSVKNDSTVRGKTSLRKKSKKKVVPIKKKSVMNVSDSDEEQQITKLKNSKKINKKESSTKDSESSDEFPSNRIKKKTLLPNLRETKNEIAKENLLKTDSEDEELKTELLHKIKKTKNHDKKSVSDEYQSEKDDVEKTFEVNPKYKPSPQSVKNSKEHKQLNILKCNVNVSKLDFEFESKLNEDGYILMEKENVSDNTNSIGSDEEFSDDSDKEFLALLKFNPQKKIKQKKTCEEKLSEEEHSSKETDEKESIKSNKSEKIEVSEKKDETSDKDVLENGEPVPEKSSDKESKKKKKELGLMDISLEENDINEQEEKPISSSEDDIDNNNLQEVDSAKKDLLESSDEDHKESNIEDSDDKEAEASFEKAKKKVEAKKKKVSSTSAEASEDNEVDTKKKKTYFSMQFSSDDEKDLKEDREEKKRKARMCIDSDSDFELSDEDENRINKKKRKIDLFSSSDSEASDLSDSNKKTKKKRRIRKASSSSDNGNDDAEEKKEETPSKKKIRKIIRDEDLGTETRNAAQEEEDRTKRLTDRQDLYNKLFEIEADKNKETLTKIVLDFDSKTKKELVSVDERLISFLKPHQAEGIKFMWDASIESLERLQDGKGSGCILAHCMGLGKTLQVVVFVHTLFSNRKVNKEIYRVMVVCPVNTVYNWVTEFKQWLKGKLLSFDVIELISAKDLWTRAYKLDDWFKEGGVMIIGYDMFRNLSNVSNKKYKGNMKTIFTKAFVTPGPHIVICDEGHILKNEKAALTKAINKIDTHRRIVLTGTPLQNNLKEYHCMIQFVKPNLLGNRKEFANRFMNPITAGQTTDAQPREVRRMKRRAHILHDLLKGCVQRFDYSVLKPFLPPKFEYVISIQLSEFQIKLYEYYLENLAQGGPKSSGSGLFVDFNNLQRIYSHPAVLYLAMIRRQNSNFEEDEEEEDEEINDFIEDTTESENSSDEKTESPENLDVEKKPEEENKEVENETAANPDGLSSSGKVKVDWWRAVIPMFYGEDGDEEDVLNRIDISGKMMLLLTILRKCTAIGDKVLLFSQSILALNMIENFLRMVDSGELELPKLDETDGDELPFRQWKEERDYLRLDGSVSADIRKIQCKKFNNEDDERCRLFLISTRAGGVGINLVGANRVIIFDSSWNPSHDTQSIFRVYRFGQKKPCYVYRFVAQGSMEEKIYSRQVTKISTSLRVVDEHQIKSHFKMDELADLYQFNPADPDIRETPQVPDDRLMAEMLITHKKWIVGYHEQDSLLENQTDEGLTEEERKAAWEDFENEKKGLIQIQQQRIQPVNMAGGATSFNLKMMAQAIYRLNPTIEQNEFHQQLLLATEQARKMHLDQFSKIQGYIYSIKNNPESQLTLGFVNTPAMWNLLMQRSLLHEESARKANAASEDIRHKLLTAKVPLYNIGPSTSKGLVSNVSMNLKNNPKMMTPPDPLYVPKPSSSNGTSSKKPESKTNAEVVTLE